MLWHQEAKVPAVPSHWDAKFRDSRRDYGFHDYKITIKTFEVHNVQLDDAGLTEAYKFGHIAKLIGRTSKTRLQKQFRNPSVLP